MNPVLERILKTQKVQSADGEIIDLHSQISPAEGEALGDIILQVKPQSSLEVGLAYGISTLFICEALAKVDAERHIVIDPHQFVIPDDDYFRPSSQQQKKGWQGIGIRHLKEAGYESMIELHNSPSHHVLPRLLEGGRKVEFAFIDGWHTFDYVMVDFFYIDKLLRVGGVVVFDDTAYPSIRKLCRYIVTNLPYTTFPISGSTGPKASAHFKRVISKASRISHRTGRIVNPEVSWPDAELGLPQGNYIALRKQGDDLLGDGAGGTRRWDAHHVF
ncbi:hypothetical protein BH20ACI3_BH20ACI3_05710 [soil metagenome]